MKTFLLYTLKIWLIAALPPSILVYWFYSVMSHNQTPAEGLTNLFNTFLYMAPAAVFAGYCMKQLYTSGISTYQRKAMIWLCAVMGLVPLTVMVSSDEPGLTTIFLLYFFSTITILITKAPSAPQAFFRQKLHGRHVTLKPDNELNSWRGMVISDFHTYPIRLKLDRSAPYPQLECHSLEKEDIFHLIADYVPVRVNACLPGKAEPLFSGVLEIDHSLN